MKKIPSLFEWDFENHCITTKVTPGCEWVIKGEGVATEKFDGTACMVRNGKLFKRYDCKRGRTPPYNFEPCQDPDPITGHWPGWVPIGDGPEDRWHWEALPQFDGLQDGTYELIGPKINGNPYGFDHPHILSRHGLIPINNNLFQRTFEGIRDFLKGASIEGIVFHRMNGDMCKIKRRDFGFEWPIKKQAMNNSEREIVFHDS